MSTISIPNGLLARQCGKQLPLSVYKSYAGFYIGTFDDDGPFTRESEEYWKIRAKAENALTKGNWTQRPHL